MATATKPNIHKLNRYPHMFPVDIAIWERFLDRFGHNFLRFAYDVKVGSGTQPTKSVRGRYRRMQEILSKYRIDAVGFKPNSIEIIEVKPDAGTIAIGQVFTYTALYRRDFSPNLPVVGAIVTDRVLPDMHYLTNLFKIRYYIV